LAFSLPLLAILLCHELGHYLTARRYNLDVSPPYFIPVPLVPSFIGTMGAFIRLRTMLSDRRQLFDVGVAGPIAGFVVALPVLVVGLALSHALPGHGPLTGMLLGLDGETAVLGDSIVTLVVRHLVHGSTPALLVHPVAFAGWVGMFVTMLNLLPISQLDGGHILSAALAATDRSRFLDAHRRAGLLLARVALLGVGRANLVARSPRAPAGARRAAAAAGVASQACVGGVGPLCHHIRAGPVPPLTREVGGGSGGCGG